MGAELATMVSSFLGEHVFLGKNKSLNRGTRNRTVMCRKICIVVLPLSWRYYRYRASHGTKCTPEPSCSGTTRGTVAARPSGTTAVLPVVPQGSFVK